MERALGYRVGEVIAGKYELVRVVGTGGMGAVWAVRNLIIDAPFALKMIRNDGGEADAAERILREARSAASIEHPAVVRIFDFGVTERGDPFLVMDLLDGTTLRELLERGPMSPAEAVKLVLPVADGLYAAHSHGVVHRDVKADNIMIVPGGVGRVQPTLVDFGIAKQLGQEARSLTADGTVIGSPEYMSPEQARGLPGLDHKTDIWSLSVVLHEMITGETPFYRSGGIGAILRAITDDPPPPLALHGIDEPGLDAILKRGLAKLPSGRFADMHAFGAALARWLLGQGVEEDASAQSIRAVWFGASASAPPVAIDAVRPSVRALGREEEADAQIPGLPRRTKTRWGVAVLVSVLATGVAFGAGLLPEGPFPATELAEGTEGALRYRGHAPSIEFVPISPENSRIGPPPPPTPSAVPVKTSRARRSPSLSYALPRDGAERSRSDAGARPTVTSPPDDLRDAPTNPESDLISPYGSDSPY